MVDPNTRQGKRTPVTLKIKFKSETLEQFIERYAVDVSQGGIFIRTKEPLAVGTQMRFEFQLRDASPLIAGEGTVVWTRENDPSRPAIAPGMGVRFDKLADGSQGVLERILSEKAKQAPVRPATDSRQPPMFTDTPTVVAPLAVQDSLLGDDPPRQRNDSGQTPLPKPVPFATDADEFPEEAFEEATKVRALDELIAQTASENTVAGPLPEVDDDDLAQRAARGSALEQSRAETSTAVVEQPSDRDSAPTLPSPPEPARPHLLLDTVPMPRMEEPSSDEHPAEQEDPEPGNKTRVGVEPAKAKTRPNATPAPAPIVPKDAPTRPSGMRAAPAAETPSAKKLPVAPEQKSSMAPTIILLLLLVAAGGAAVWFFVLRPKAEPTVAVTSNTNGSAVAKTNDPPVNPTNGSGSAANNGSAGSGSDAVANHGSGVGSGSDAVALNHGSGAGSGSNAVANSGSGAGSGSAVPTNAGSNAVANNGSGDPTNAPPAKVDTLVGSSVAGAQIEILGTAFAGKAPLRAKLERGKGYKARVTAPGFVAQEVAFKGGERPTARLEPKPRTVTIASDPAGALIFIDSANSGFVTPHTMDLNASQLARKSMRITLRKNGFKPVDKTLDVSAYRDDGAKMTASINETLPVQTNTPAPTPPKPPAGSGSDATPPAGTGSAAPTPPPADTGASAPPPPPSGGDKLEPEPDFAK